METNYHKIGTSIADTIGKVARKLTMEQRMFLVGAISPWLQQRDARIAELEKELLARGGHNSDCPVSWKGECYCGWEEMKKSLMVRSS